MKHQEKAIVFNCQGDVLVGVIHIPEKPRKQGILSIIADAPQYRTGGGRHTVQFARSLAKKGTPFMRFDSRGIGDSSGPCLGLERKDDIAAAIAQFIAHIPEMDEVILYGGCEAASTIAIHGWHFPQVTGWILVNPWVYTEEEHARVIIKYYYLQRLISRDFWNKILSFKFDLKTSITSFLRLRKIAKQETTNTSIAIDPTDTSISFEIRMFAGWEKFNGRVLIINGERSIVAKEFDSYVKQSPQRRNLLERKKTRYYTIKNADHAFSAPEVRDIFVQTIDDWLDILSS